MGACLCTGCTSSSYYADVADIGKAPPPTADDRLHPVLCKLPLTHLKDCKPSPNPQLVVGRITFIPPHKPIHSISTGEPVVFYHVRFKECVEHYNGRTRSYNWEHRSGERNGVDFVLVDPENTSNQLFVKGTVVPIFKHTDDRSSAEKVIGSYNYSGPGNERIVQFVKRHDRQADNKRTQHSQHRPGGANPTMVEESFLPVGALVAVLGIVGHAHGTDFLQPVTNESVAQLGHWRHQVGIDMNTWQNGLPAEPHVIVSDAQAIIGRVKIPALQIPKDVEPPADQSQSDPWQVPKTNEPAVQQHVAYFPKHRDESDDPVHGHGHGHGHTRGHHDRVAPLDTLTDDYPATGTHDHNHHHKQ